jgi:hypothetical protein
MYQKQQLTPRKMVNWGQDCVHCNKRVPVINIFGLWISKKRAWSAHLTWRHWQCEVPRSLRKYMHALYMNIRPMKLDYMVLVDQFLKSSEGTFIFHLKIFNILASWHMDRFSDRGSRSSMRWARTSVWNRYSYNPDTITCTEMHA